MSSKPNMSEKLQKEIDEAVDIISNDADIYNTWHKTAKDAVNFIVALHPKCLEDKRKSDLISAASEMVASEMHGNVKSLCIYSEKKSKVIIKTNAFYEAILDEVNWIDIAKMHVVKVVQEWND